MLRIVIIGAGGFAREVLDIFMARNTVSPQYEILGFIDEYPDHWGRTLNGYPVLGGFDWFDTRDKGEIRVICGVGNPVVRRKLVQKAVARGLEFCNITHPTAILTPFVTLGRGVVITGGSIFTNQITLGSHVHVNLDGTNNKQLRAARGPEARMTGHPPVKSSVRDLAVLGGAPAFAEPLYVGRPNVGDRNQFLKRLTDMLDRRWLTNDGPMLKEFEQRVATLLGVRHCVAVTNGTVPLELTIRALELHGEVIIPAFTFVATAHALQWHGITPVFCDIDPTTHTLDPRAVEAAVTPQTSGIIGV